MKTCFIKWLLASILSTNLSLSAGQPFSSIQSLPYTPYFVQDAYVFYNLISAHSAAVIIDVESHDGGVARYIAQQAEILPSLREIYSVNAWQSADRSQKHLFQRFLSNVNHENLAERIIPIRMSSQEGSEALNVVADFISLVGGNDAQGIYNDIIAWYPHLSNIGVICGNNWDEASIKIGVAKAAAALDLTLKLSGNVWYFEKE